MTNEKPRLYLHMGMGKTGSSALQIGFVRNQDALAAANTVYPASQTTIEAAHADKVMSGNGGIIRRLLVEDSIDQEDAWTAVQRKIENVGSRHVLFSSEVLFMARPKNLDQLVEHLNELGRSLHPILYVRNVAGHALSSYGQRIKRAGATDTLSEYCVEKYRPNYRNTLEKLLDVVPQSAVSVVHYDTERENLFAHFLYEVLGAPSTTRITDPVVRRVNRSLTRGELAILRRVNAMRTRTGPRLLSDALLGEFPHAPDEKSIPSDLISALHERFGDEVDWVNRHFFDDSRLSIASDELNVSHDAPDVAQISATERVLLGVIGAANAEQEAKK